MKYKIEDNIPIPIRSRHLDQPYARLKVGQSFEIKGYAAFITMRQEAHIFAIVQRKEGKAMRFTSRGIAPFKVPQAHPDYRSKQWRDKYVGRIWRIE